MCLSIGKGCRKPVWNREISEIIEDLPKLPFTYKQDLRDTYPYGMFAVPLSEIVRIHASSGTTGKQTVVGYTRRDLDTWAEVMARTFVCAGADRNSFIQVAYGYGLFTGGLGPITALKESALQLFRFQEGTRKDNCR